MKHTKQISRKYKIKATVENINTMILFLKKYIQVDYLSILSLTEDRLFPHHCRISGNYGNKYKLHQTHEKKCLCNEYDRDS